VHSVNVTSLNVFEQQGQTFTCELEIEAEISLEIDIEIAGHYGYGGPDDYEPSRRYSISQSRTEYFYPEVIVRFEPSTGSLEFESISFGTQSVRVSLDDVEGHLYR